MRLHRVVVHYGGGLIRAVGTPHAGDPGSAGSVGVVPLRQATVRVKNGQNSGIACAIVTHTAAEVVGTCLVGVEGNRMKSGGLSAGVAADC